MIIVSNYSCQNLVYSFWAREIILKKQNPKGRVACLFVPSASHAFVLALPSQAFPTVLLTHCLLSYSFHFDAFLPLCFLFKHPGFLHSQVTL